MEYVLITGATSGIGYEFSKIFAEKGYGLVLVSSSVERLERTKKNLMKEFNVPIYILKQDLTKLGAAKEIYINVEKENLSISILINNAGFGLVGPTDKIDINKDEEMLIINDINLVELTKLFISDMYKRGKGKILNVASTGAFQPGPYTSTYFASKAFVLSYSRAVRYEAKEKGVQICVLCPGATKTNFFNAEGTITPKDAMSAKEVANIAVKRLMKNKEVTITGMKNKLLQLLPVKIKMIGVANMKSNK